MHLILCHKVDVLGHFLARDPLWFDSHEPLPVPPVSNHKIVPVLMVIYGRFECTFLSPVPHYDI